MIKCELYEEIDHYAWQEYVSSHPSSGIYHHIGWKSVIEEAYGHTALYLIAKNNNEVIGILPLILIKSRIFGSSLTSLPYLDHSGIIADDTSIQNLLIEKAQKLGQNYAVDHLELRQLEISEGDFSNYSEKVLMIMELEENEDALLKKLSSERRNRIKRAKKSGLSVEITDSSKLHIFYEIWTNNMRDLGSPPHSLLFFKNILHNFDDHCTILLVKTDGVYIGAALALHWKDTITIHGFLHYVNISKYTLIIFCIGKLCVLLLVKILSFLILVVQPMDQALTSLKKGGAQLPDLFIGSI